MPIRRNSLQHSFFDILYKPNRLCKQASGIYMGKHNELKLVQNVVYIEERINYDPIFLHFLNFKPLYLDFY